MVMVLCSQNVVVRDKVQIIVKNIGNRTISGPMKEFALAMNISFSLPVFQAVQVDALLVPTNVLLLVNMNISVVGICVNIDNAVIGMQILVWSGVVGMIGILAVLVNIVLKVYAIIIVQVQIPTVGAPVVLTVIASIPININVLVIGFKEDM